jgi:hypothetical protein
MVTRSTAKKAPDLQAINAMGDPGLEPGGGIGDGRGLGRSCRQQKGFSLECLSVLLVHASSKPVEEVAGDGDGSNAEPLSLAGAVRVRGHLE